MSLMLAKVASLTLANRTLEHADEMLARMSSIARVTECTAVELGADAEEPVRKADLVINATSAGVKGEVPPYPAAAISKNSFCYDLSYGLQPTPFSVWARDVGAPQSVMGWGMLVEQAAESFSIWRGVRPDTAPVLKQMKITA